MKKVAEEEPIEQLFAEVTGYLVEADDVLLPSLEAKVRDVRDLVKQAQGLLSRLELQVTRHQPKSAAAK